MPVSIHVALADILSFKWFFIGKVHEVVLYLSVFRSKRFILAKYVVRNAVFLSSLQVPKEVFQVPILAVDELILMAIVTRYSSKAILVLLKLFRILSLKTFKVFLELL